MLSRKHLDGIGQVHLRMADGATRVAWPVDARQFIAAGATVLPPPQVKKPGAEEAIAASAPASVGMTEQEMADMGIEA